MTTHQEEHLIDRAAMALMRAMLAVQPKLQFIPDARPAFDELMEKMPEATDVTYEAAEIGGVTGWWCRPQQARSDSAIVYLHGGAYVLGPRRLIATRASQPQVLKRRIDMSESTTPYPPVPPDDLKRALTTARPDTDQTLPTSDSSETPTRSPFHAKIPLVASALLTCTFRQEAVLRRIGSVSQIVGLSLDLRHCSLVNSR
jgi:hypothetical protein